MRRPWTVAERTVKPSGPGSSAAEPRGLALTSARHPRRTWRRRCGNAVVITAEPMLCSLPVID
jgi:hypothetical protein